MAQMPASFFPIPENLDRPDSGLPRKGTVSLGIREPGCGAARPTAGPVLSVTVTSGGVATVTCGTCVPFGDSFARLSVVSGDGHAARITSGSEPCSVPTHTGAAARFTRESEFHSVGWRAAGAGGARRGWEQPLSHAPCLLSSPIRRTALPCSFRKDPSSPCWTVAVSREPPARGHIPFRDHGAAFSRDGLPAGPLGVCVTSRSCL